ncbi:MAG: hypothetical protein LBE38_06860 [Deltaproteobacteria bacterium]|jgi:hypothetical protein|nr:hypothetical protein [Deltaproteobacteria bacterium]
MSIKVNPGNFVLMLFLLFVVSLFQINSLNAEDWTTFSTKNHAKSNGLNITVRYPSNYTAKEGKRPHVVQLFSAPMGPIHNYGNNLILLVFPLDHNGYQLLMSPSFTVDNFMEIVFQEFNVIQVIYKKDINHENQKGFMFAVLVTLERAGDTKIGIIESLYVIYNNSLIQAQCGSITDDLSELGIENLKSYHQNNSYIYKEFFNSLTLLDQYQ